MDRLLKFDDVTKLTGFTKVHIYNIMRQGLFPKSKRVGKRSVRWLESEVKEWLENLPDGGHTEEDGE